MGPPDSTNSIPSEETKRFLILATIIALGLGAYFVLRFGGNWIEVDTERMTRSAQAVLDQATLQPTSDAYPFGFNYPALTAFIAQIAGVSVLELQTKVFPMVGTLLVTFVSFALFREILGKGRVAMLGTILLFMQGDLLFVTLRGSHEKLTWPLLMLALFLLYRSSAKPEKLAVLATYVGLFYLTIFAAVATSAFFSSSLIAAITFSLLLGLAIAGWRGRRRADLGRNQFQRLFLVSASSTILLYLSVFYVYVPGRQVLSTLPTILDRIAGLLLGFQLQANPYAYIGFGWTSAGAYLVLSLFTWIIILVSLTEWARQGISFIRGKHLHLPENLPWLLYTGFAVQIAGAVALDLSGSLSANLELRLLPALVILSVVLAGSAMRRIWRAVQNSRWRRRLLTAASAGLMGFFVAASLIKATNDPAVSNKWTFYSSGEKAAIGWSAGHLQEAHVWAGIDDRLPTLFDAIYGEHPTSGIRLEPDPVQAETNYFLQSDVERLRDARLGLKPPQLTLENRSYDNGDTQLYAKRP